MVRSTTRALIIPIGPALLAAALIAFCPTGAGAADEVTDEEIAALIEQLGDPEFVVRDRAQTELGKLGERAWNALTVAANDNDLEVAKRARYLLQTIDLPAVRDTDSDRVKEMLEGYANVSTAEQLGIVRSLMGLPEGEGYRAACRLAHIESSLVMSKYIATTILNRWPVHSEGRARMRKAVEAELKQSGQEVASWLTTYAGLDADPKPNLARWRKIVEGEESLLAERSRRSGDRVVATLLYDLAYWETENGAADLATRHFERAQRIKLTPSSSTIYFYLDTAYFYRNRGEIDRAADVFKQVATLGYVQAVPLAQFGLAEMFHDMGRHREAAAALDAIAQLLDSRQLRDLEYMDHSIEQLRGRKHFFLACQARDDGDDEKYRAELSEAVKNDPNELDSLIALYRVPDLDDATRKKTTTMIEVAANRLRQEADAEPDDASAHNEFAWLVGNTTGDMQEALKHALRAIELSPESGAYLDTLAHVYFYGLKDYDKAVETQAKAVEFMPHSGLILKKYELFRKAAEDGKSE